MLLSFEDYQKLVGSQRSLLDVVAQAEDDDIDFDPPRMGEKIFRDVDLD